jgi:hypothetical protein
MATEEVSHVVTGERRLRRLIKKTNVKAVLYTDV